jgi:hypothetical protein
MAALLLAKLVKRAMHRLLAPVTQAPTSLVSASNEVFIDGVNLADVAVSDAVSRALPFAAGENRVSCRATGPGTGFNLDLSH